MVNTALSEIKIWPKGGSAALDPSLRDAIDLYIGIKFIFWGVFFLSLVYMFL